MHRSSAVRAGGCAAAAVVGLALSACTPAGWDDLPAAGTAWTLADVYGGGWDRALVACPYESPDAFSAAHGLQYPGPDLSARDDVQVVLLLDGEQVVEQDVVGRQVVDLCASDLGDLTPDDALVVEVAPPFEKPVRRL